MSTCRPEQILERLRAEYLEMPGMRLNLEQVQRLCGIERSMCKLALDALLESKFLCVRSDGPTCGSPTLVFLTSVRR